jgi:hypothetical protein
MDHAIRNCAFENLSSINLSRPQVTALARGTNFIPSTTPKLPTLTAHLKQAMSTYARNIRLRTYFHDSEDNRSELAKKLHTRSSFTPDDHLITPFVKTYEERTKTDLLRVVQFHETPSAFQNITKRELLAFEDLAKDPRVRLIDCDKNLGTRLVNESWYNAQAMLHLKDTKTYRIRPLQQALAFVKLACRSMDVWIASYPPDEPDHPLDRTVKRFITSFMPQRKVFNRLEDWMEKRWNTFRLIIKVHKSPHRSRPISPSLNYITTGLSKWLDATLQPYVVRHKSICKGSIDFLSELGELHVPNDYVLITCDVVSLYPSIPFNANTERIIKNLFRTPPFSFSKRFADTVWNAIALIHKCHIIKHEDGKFYHQISGTAMGVAAAVAVANCFMLALELDKGLHTQAGMLLYRRYIDDILAILHRRHLEDFKRNMDNADPQHIKFTYESSESAIPFLDLEIFRSPTSPNKLQTRLYRKATFDASVYLPWSSLHTPASKKSFIYGELLRMCRVCSNFEDYHDAKLRFVKHLRARGFPIEFITAAMEPIRFTNRPALLAPQEKKNAERPLIFNCKYDATTKHLHLGKLLRQHWELLKVDHSTQDIPQPLLAFSKSDALGTMNNKCLKARIRLSRAPI